MKDIEYPLDHPVIKIIRSRKQDHSITWISVFLQELVLQGIITDDQEELAKRYIIDCQKEKE